MEKYGKQIKIGQDNYCLPDLDYSTRQNIIKKQ